ncbi:MAG: CPBP family intramembrane metalloprotease, partial [Deltaproteobacteria bacterium]|nr:CPBP family intramembrane metalloprotease [Deltaproteobacteria bacterium]
WTAPRRDFHIALLVSFVPILSLPVTWILASLSARRGAPEPGDRVWIRGLVALALVDTAIAFVLVAGIPRVTAAILARTRAAARPTIGVILDPGTAAPHGGAPRVRGCGVRRVLAGTPAARAGLRAGDRIVAVDDASIGDCSALRGAVEKSLKGHARRFRVRRRGMALTKTIIPLANAAQRALAKRTALFEGSEPCPDGVSPGGFSVGDGQLRALAVVAALFLVAFVGWWRGAWRPLRVVGILTVVLALGYLLVPLGVKALLCALTGGVGLGAVLVALVAGPAVVVAILAVLLPRLRRMGALDSRPGLVTTVTPWAALGLGIAYAFAGVWRVRVLGLFVEGFGSGGGGTDPAFTGLLTQATATPVALALFALAAAFVGPLAEELMMRGLLLPWLTSWLDHRVALALASLAFALLHAQYGAADLVAVFWLGWVFGWARLRSG